METIYMEKKNVEEIVSSESEEQVISNENPSDTEAVLEEATPVEENIEKKEGKPKKKRREPKRLGKLDHRFIHEITEENDIKFRGPLSYRHLRILGWLFMAIAQIAVVLRFSAVLFKNEAMYGAAPEVLGFFGSLMAPLFLIAAFSTVIVAKDGYRKLLILYGGLSLLVVGAFTLVYIHFFVGSFKMLSDPTPFEDAAALLSLFTKGQGYMAFNIFLDLFLCTLVTFFINYTPKQYFQGKKLIIFRLFALIPVIFEVVTIILKVLTSNDIIALTPFLWPLLPTKAPMAFMVFVVMALIIRIRERHFLKKGKTSEDYKKFRTTKVDSLHFSINLSITIVVAVVIDIALLLILSINQLTLVPDFEQMPANLQWDTFLVEVTKVAGWGFGKTLALLLIIPIIMFFDYQKTYKNKKLDTLIPAIGIGIIAIIYIEGGFEALRFYLIEQAKNADNDPAPAQLIHKVINVFRGRK